MKKQIFAIIICLCTWISFAFAGEVHLKWDANSEPDIAGYKIYMGIQSEAVWTWQEIGDANETSFIYNAPEDGLYLFRVSAYDSNGQETIRLKSGIFYNELWAPVKIPSNVGVK